MSTTENATITINVGDTQKPFGFKLTRPDGRIVDVTDLTVKVFGKKNDGTTWIAESADNVTKQPGATFTVDSTDDWILCNDHLAEKDDQITVSSDTALPGGLAASTRYTVTDCHRNRFRVSQFANGPKVDITSAGTGAHTFKIVNAGSYQWQAADLATATATGKPNYLWIRTENGSSKPETFPIVRNPKDRGLPVEIVEAS